METNTWNTFLFVAQFACYIVMAWSVITMVFMYTFERRKIRPIQSRINRVDYEIDEIVGSDYSKYDLPEVVALQKSRDIDALELNDLREQLSVLVYKWSLMRLFPPDPYSPEAMHHKRERKRLMKKLGMDD